jgi:hypothetical protein
MHIYKLSIYYLFSGSYSRYAPAKMPLHTAVAPFHRQLHVRGPCANTDDARNARRFGDRGGGRDGGIGEGAYAVGGAVQIVGETVVLGPSLASLPVLQGAAKWDAEGDPWSVVSGLWN